MIDMIKKLRDVTGAGVSACKAALTAANGDLDKAIEQLRQDGARKAAAKSGRGTSAGIVHAYVHADKIGVLVEVRCETDFVARNEKFKTFAHEVALQIAAMNPLYLDRGDVPASVLAYEEHLAMQDTQGKPAHVVTKIVEGRIQKWLQGVCLMAQPWVRDDSKTIKDLQNALVSALGENVRIKRFTRFEQE